jgi:FixJ family two-component response regulator
VVDDDDAAREYVRWLLESAGWTVRAYDGAQDFLDGYDATCPGCLVTDVRMPGLSGLELQAELTRQQRDVPTVFISGHGNAAATVQAMKAGAVTYLAKPFSKEELLAAVREALERSTRLGDERRRRSALTARYESLTPREREVFALVAAGRLNKVIADRLGAAEATVKIHRGRVMEKMGADSVADLVRMAGSLGVPASAAPNRDGAAPPAP